MGVFCDRMRRVPRWCGVGVTGPGCRNDGRRSVGSHPGTACGAETRSPVDRTTPFSVPVFSVGLFRLVSPGVVLSGVLRSSPEGPRGHGRKGKRNLHLDSGV